MKTKKMLTLALAAAMALTVTVSVAAEEIELTPASPEGQTEVTAKIVGAAGDVSYIITIPDVVDFGVLSQPDNDTEDHFADKAYKVTAKQITGMNPDEQQVGVYVKNQGATVGGDPKFYITNKADSSKSFYYDIYDCPAAQIADNTANINANAMPYAIGYKLVGFSETGEEVNGTLRLNQNQLYGLNIAEYVGDYSGYMVFYSMIEDI